MEPFKLYECDVGIKVNSVEYKFSDVDEVQIEDPERNQLTRGANATNTEGLAYKDGLKEPKKWTMQIKNMSIALKAVLDSCFVNQTRLEVFAISRKSGASKMLKRAILANTPQQLNLDETPESMQIALEFISFQQSEVYKE